jgi:hypothetical protein
VNGVETHRPFHSDYSKAPSKTARKKGPRKTYPLWQTVSAFYRRNTQRILVSRLNGKQLLDLLDLQDSRTDVRIAVPPRVEHQPETGGFYLHQIGPHKYRLKKSGQKLLTLVSQRYLYPVNDSKIGASFEPRHIDLLHPNHLLWASRTNQRATK